MDDLQVELKKAKIENGNAKGRKSCAPTIKNFGAHLCISKLKSTDTMSIGWRCRFLGHILPYLVFA